MPSHKYSEICVGHNIEYYPNSAGLWNEYSKMHSFVEWRIVKVVAKRHLTDCQYRIFVLRGEWGLKHEDIGLIMGSVRQSAVDNLYLAVKKLKKVFKKYLQNRVYMKGGFREHVFREHLVKEGLYNEFRRKKLREAEYLDL